MPRLDERVEYRGYKYNSWIDTEYDATGRPENHKRWHEIISPEGVVIDGPWGPYETITKEEFDEYIRNKFCGGQ